MHLETIKELIAAKYDSLEILDILDIENKELLDAFEDKLIENLTYFEEVLEEIDD